ncbi:MAG: discoidin domain-containing protein [Verrucomicrobia bacterium]|nr:discoidin domain-containing protein [Verrucomicrobiota bacterium]
MISLSKCSLSVALLLAGFSSLSPAEKPGEKIYQRGFLAIEESQKSIELPDGYSLELVVTEPQVEEPVMVAWDGNGVMYVVQMRTYMQNADAGGEQEPKSRITRHEDTNGDGTYDKFSIYANDLLLPRFVLPLDDRVLVGLTNTLDLWTYRDTTGDGVADEKVKVYEGGNRGGNMEHQPSGLMWNLDNWLYLTYEAKRYRFTNGKLEVQGLPRGSGQWGLSQDDWGRMYFSRAGGEVPAVDYQQPLAYGTMDLPGQEEAGFRTVYPIAEIPDVQGGERRVGPNGGLNNFTGCAGQSIFRGDRLPAELRGDLFIPEPVGRLIRRVQVDRQDAKSVLRNRTPGAEFLRTRDANFRPVWSATTPGGQLMIVDMHRGIIQQGNWTRPGSYLRGVIDKWGLDKNIGKGRIYRLVHKDFKAGPQPRMLEDSTEALVAHLSHPNGWWRDTAQKLIILRKDRESVVPLLEKTVLEGKSEYGRLHALWTLEGIGKVNPAVLAVALKDEASIVRTSAVRVAEPFMAAEDATVIAALTAPLPRDAEMAVQMLNSLNASGSSHPGLLDVGAQIVDGYRESEAVQAVLRSKGAAANEAMAAAARQKQGKRFAESMERGKAIYQQLCFACHGADGQGAPMVGREGEKLAPSFTGSPRIVGSGDSAVRVILNGLTGQVDGKTYEGLMVAMANNDDQWIADVITYVRNSFENTAPAITKHQVAALRKAHSSRTEPWTQEELENLEPPLLRYNEDWKLSASDNAGTLKLAFDGDASSRYATNKGMENGMWVQIEFPGKVRLNAVTLDARGSASDYPRGYKVEVSDDGKKWSKPVAEGNGKGALQEIKFAPVEGKFLRITQTGNGGRFYWSIHELTVLGKRS